MPSFGSYLRHQLRLRGLTQAELARLTGFTRSQVNDLLSGRRPMPAAHEAKFIKALGLDGEEIETFRDWAAISHCPPRAQELILAAYTTLGEAAGG